jgi:hypothetical protein
VAGVRRPTPDEIREGLRRQHVNSALLADVVVQFMQTLTDKELSARYSPRGLAMLQSQFVVFLRDHCNYRALGAHIQGRIASPRKLGALAARLLEAGDAARVFAARQVTFSSLAMQESARREDEGLTFGDLLGVQPDLLIPNSLTFQQGS